MDTDLYQVLCVDNNLQLATQLHESGVFLTADERINATKLNDFSIIVWLEEHGYNPPASYAVQADNIKIIKFLINTCSLNQDGIFTIDDYEILIERGDIDVLDYYAKKCGNDFIIELDCLLPFAIDKECIDFFTWLNSKNYRYSENTKKYIREKGSVNIIRFFISNGIFDDELEDIKKLCRKIENIEEYMETLLRKMFHKQESLH